MMREVPVKLSDEDLRRRFDLKKLKREFPDEAELIRYLYHEKELSQREIGVILGRHQANVCYKMKKYGIEARSQAEAQTIAHGHADERKPFDGNDREKCYLMGFVKGDAHVRIFGETGQTIEVMCTSSVPEQIELFKELFGCYGYVSEGEPDEDGQVDVSVTLDLRSFAWLLNLGDRIPSLAFANDENFFAFVGGYSDAEAFIGIASEVARFSLASYDKAILYQIHEKLIELGIEFTKPKISKPKDTPFITPNGKTYRTNQDCWYLNTARKEMLLKLFERLGPYLRHPKKIEGMKAAIKNIKDRNACWERKRKREERFKELLAKKEELVHRFSNEAELLRYLYDEEGLSQQMIGEIVGCHQTTVSLKMKKCGIKTRTMSEAKTVEWDYPFGSQGPGCERIMSMTTSEVHGQIVGL